jgi:hypothetical protein
MMENKHCGIEGVIVFIDDVLIYAGDLQTLGERTGAVIQALSASKLTINEEKSEHAKSKITFLGHELSSEGFAIDGDKVKAVREFGRPTNPTSLVLERLCAKIRRLGSANVRRDQENPLRTDRGSSEIFRK